MRLRAGVGAVVLLAPLAGACRIAFDARVDAGDGDAVAIDAPDAGPPPTVLQIDIVILDQVRSCLIGDPCAANCISLYNAGGETVRFLKNANFAAVAPGDPRIQTAAQSQCVTLGMGDAERGMIEQAAAELETTIETWTQGTLQLDVRIRRSVADTLMLVFNFDSLWLGPGEVPAAIRSAIGADSDMVFVTQDLWDDGLAMRLPMANCSLSFGHEAGLAGAAYSWIPYTGSAGLGFECFTYGNLRNHVMGHMYRALTTLHAFDDLYDGTYPACGNGDPDPTRWFPDPGPHCLADPDYENCGGTSCSDGAEAVFHEHIMRAHWVRDRIVNGNHCANGVMDFGESGVDTGANCP